MGELRILGKEGDTKVIWSPDNDDEVEAAEAQFNSLTKKGFTAYEVGRTGRKTSRKVTQFDPDLGKLIMVPRAVGG